MPKVIFVAPDGQSRQQVDAPDGASLLEVAQANDIDIEGACEGVMACATCHLIVDTAFFALLPPADEDEEDMLDLVFELEATSRLGCQIHVTQALDGLIVRLPRSTRNLLLG